MRPCIEGLHGGQTCDNLLRDNTNLEERPCPTSKPCPEDCKVKTWGEWSRCSKGCGTGKTERDRIIHGPFHGGQDCNVKATKDDIRCQKRTQNYRGKEGITTIPTVRSWPECLQKCLAEDTCNHWVMYQNNKCELISSYTSSYNDPSVEVSGPKICTHYHSREVKDCYLQRCPDCRYGGWSNWSECGYCRYNAGNYQTRSRQIMMPTGNTEFNGVTLKCEGHDTQTDPCYGSWGYWIVAAATVGLGNLVIC